MRCVVGAVLDRIKVYTRVKGAFGRPFCRSRNEWFDRRVGGENGDELEFAAVEEAEVA